MVNVLVCDRCGKAQPPKEIGQWYRLTLTGTSETYGAPMRAGNDLCPECAKALAETEDWILLP